MSTSSKSSTVYYRSGPEQGITRFIPREPRTVHDSEFRDRSVLYASSSAQYAAGFCFEWKDTEGFRFERINSDQYQLIVPESHLHRLSQPCSMYQIVGDFIALPNSSVPEYISQSPARVVWERRFRSCAECLEFYNIRIVRSSITRIVRKIHNRMDRIRYDNFESETDYIFRTPDQLLSDRRGVCYDIVSYTAQLFELRGIPYRLYFAYAGLPVSDNRTHTFLVFRYKKSWYWFESSWKPWSGIHGSFSGVRELLHRVGSLLVESGWEDYRIREYRLFDGVGMNLNQYGQHIVDQLPIGLRLDSSVIHGTGVFAENFIPNGANIGVAFCRISNTGEADRDFHRTRLGRYVNHSSNPNVRLINCSGIYSYRTIAPIRSGTEIVVDYAQFPW